MRTFSAFFLCWIAPFTVVAQGSTPGAQGTKPVQPATAQTSVTSTQAAAEISAPSIDPAKEAAIRNMFEVLGTAKMMNKVIAGRVPA